MNNDPIEPGHGGIRLWPFFVFLAGMGLGTLTPVSFQPPAPAQHHLILSPRFLYDSKPPAGWTISTELTVIGVRYYHADEAFDRDRATAIIRELSRQCNCFKEAEVQSVSQEVKLQLDDNHSWFDVNQRVNEALAAIYGGEAAK